MAEKEETKTKEETEAKEKTKVETEKKVRLKPLSEEERAELDKLEEMANRGKYQPDPPQMLRLGKLRQRGKNRVVNQRNRHRR